MGSGLNKTKIAHKNKPAQSSHNKQRLSPGWQLGIFALVIILIYGVVFNTVYTTPYSGTGLFYDFASNVMHGQVPYLNFSLEYPPLALLFFILPRLASSAMGIFVVLYKIEVLLAILAGLFLIYKLARRLGKAPWKMMLVYTLCILAVVPIIAEQYDIFPAILTLGSLYAFIAGKIRRPGRCWRWAL